MKRFSKILRRSTLLLCGVVLGGCGYGSYPGIVVETQEYPLHGKTKLIVTRHLDGWKTGSLFTFEWYVVKCQVGNVPEIILLQDMIPRGLYSNEIPKKRIQITDGEIGYAYFNSIVVFNKNCNKLSEFYPWNMSIINPGTVAAGYDIESANVEQTGRGYARLTWTLKKGGARTLEVKTNDFGLHWTLPNSDVDVRKSNQETTNKFEQSNNSTNTKPNKQ